MSAEQSVCLECGAVWYSPPAALAVAGADGCLICGGALAEATGDGAKGDEAGEPDGAPPGPDDRA